MSALPNWACGPVLAICLAFCLLETANSCLAQKESDRRKDSDDWMRQVEPGVYVIGRRNKYADVGNCTSFAVSPDARTIVFGSTTHLKFWDEEKSRIEHAVELNTQNCFHVEFSPDGRYLACVCAMYPSVVDGTTDDSPIVALELYDAITHEQLWTREVEATDPESEKYFIPLGLRFSPNCELLALPSFQQAKIIDVETGNEVSNFRFSSRANSFCFSPDGKKLVVGGPVVQTYDIKSRRRIKNAKLEFLKGRVNAICTNHDKDLIAFTDSQKFELRNSKTGEEIQLKEKSKAERVQNLVLSDDGKRIAAQVFSPAKKNGLYGTSILVWDVSTGELIKEHNSNGVFYRKILFSADGAKLLLHMIGAAGISEVKIAETSSRLVGNSIPNNKAGFEEPLAGPATSVTFAGDGRRFASTAMTGRVRIFDLKTGKITTAIRAQPGNTLSFSRDNKELLFEAAHSTGDGDVLAMSMDIDREKVVHQFATPRSMIKTSPGMMFKSLMTGGASTPIERQSPLRPLVTRYSSDGKMVMCVGYRANQEIWISKWNASTGSNKEMIKLNKNRIFQGLAGDAAINSNGSRIAIAGKDIEIHDTLKNNVIQEFDGSPAGGYDYVLFSPDNNFLAATHVRLGVRVWISIQKKWFSKARTGAWDLD